MFQGLHAIIIPVQDLDKAKPVYGTLFGVEPYADEPYYVGYKVDGKDVGLDPTGHKKGMTGPIAYWRVDDIKETLQTLLDAGAETVQEPTDVGGGMLIATVKDADGNIIGLGQPS